jgi:hypothetical protein
MKGDVSVYTIQQEFFIEAVSTITDKKIITKDPVTKNLTASIFITSEKEGEDLVNKLNEYIATNFTKFIRSKGEDTKKVNRNVVFEHTNNGKVLTIVTI